MEHHYAMVIDKEIVQVLTTPFLHIECDEQVSDVTHFYNTSLGKLELKAALNPKIITKGLKVTITGIPSGLKVETNGLSTLTDDLPLVIEYDIPGKYEIILSGRVEFLDRTLEVTVGNS